MGFCDLFFFGSAIFDLLKVCAYNRTVEKVDRFLHNEAKNTNIVGAHTIKEMVEKLKRPRRVMLMVQAGKAVDDFIQQLLPYLEAGDIIIDGGNSEYKHTHRRCNELKEKGLFYIGTGVSGGEEGARYGPSIMPGGAPEAWPHVKDIFQAISAKVDGEPCCDWVGESGSGHYVKMVHNGIEYGDMQLICEAYNIMQSALGLSFSEMAEVFDEWNKTELDSFLIEITADILKYKENGQYLLPLIKDSAGQVNGRLKKKIIYFLSFFQCFKKGTGKWTAIEALDSGTPVTLIGNDVSSLN